MAIASSPGRVAAVAVWLACGLLPATSWAQPASSPSDPPSPREIPLAEQLFQEGKRLLDEGRVSEACPKFVESQRLDPGGGTLMNVARCHRLDGKLASAWAAFVEARTVARREGRADREGEADGQIKEIVPLLPYLTVVVPLDVAALPGFEIRRNGAAMGQAALGSAIPVDPGLQTIVVQASGYKPNVQEVRIEGAGTTTVTVPMLERSPDPAPAPIAPILKPTLVAPVRGTSAVTVAGYVIGGTGIVAVVLGVAAGGVALSKEGDANDLCPGTVCAQNAVDLNGDARAAATLANAGIFGGGALIGLAVVLIVTSASDDASAVSASARGVTFSF